jgi:hypothetical protein
LPNLLFLRGWPPKGVSVDLAAAFLRRLLIKHNARIKAIKARAPNVAPIAMAVVLIDVFMSSSGFAVADEVLDELAEVAVFVAVLFATARHAGTSGFAPKE